MTAGMEASDRFINGWRIGTAQLLVENQNTVGPRGLYWRIREAKPAVQ